MGAHRLRVLDVEQLGGVVPPGDAGEPVQVVARHVELAAGGLQGRQLGQLLFNDLPRALGYLALVRLQALPEPAARV